MFPHNHQYFQNQHDRQHQQQCFMQQENNFQRTERQKWNKSNTELNFEYPDREKMIMNQKRHEEYLFKLHLNNQILKKASQKDKKVEKLEKLEVGFNLYVNGAHKKGEKYTPRHTITKSTEQKRNLDFKPMIHGSNTNKFSDLFEDMDRAKSAPNVATRKKWSNSSFTIKTSDGYEIKINAPSYDKPQISKSDITSNKNKNRKLNDNEFLYSDDFESDSDTETTKQSDKEKNLIQSVKFSDISDLDDDEPRVTTKPKQKKNSQKQKDKKLVLELTPSDIKSLRQSIQFLNCSTDLQTDSDIDLDESLASINIGQKKNKNNTQFKTTFNTINDEDESLDEIEEEIGSDLEKSVETSSMCEMIMKKVANLKIKDRNSLADFLNKIDDHLMDKSENGNEKN